MAEMGIGLYGPATPSFDPKAGPLTALVEVEGGTSAYLVDRERGRARLATLPFADPEKWVSPSGVLLIARRNWWGLSIFMDDYPCPELSPSPSTPPDVGPGDFKRPRLPRDLASCLFCGETVVLRRSRGDDPPRIVNPTRRLAARASLVMEGAGLLPFAAGATGRGRVAGLEHGRFCHHLPGFRRVDE